MLAYAAAATLEVRSAEAILNSFVVAFLAVAEIFLLGIIGFLAVRRRVLGPDAIQSLGHLMVEFMVPAMLFTSMVRGFDLHKMAPLSLMIGLAIGISALGMGLGWLVTRIWAHGPRGNSGDDRVVVSMSGLMNSFYLPMPLALALLPPDQQDEGIMYLGAVVLVASFLQWTVGVALLRKRDAGHGVSTPQTIAASAAGIGKGEWIMRRARLFMSPPLLGMLAGCLVAQIPGAQAGINGTLLGWERLLALPLRAIATVAPIVGPLAMVMLGAILATNPLVNQVRWRPVFLTCLVRLIVVPAIVWWVALRWIKPGPVFFLMLMIEAAAPPATNHSIIALRYGDNAGQVSAILLASCIVGVLTLPLWIGLVL